MNVDKKLKEFTLVCGKTAEELHEEQLHFKKYCCDSSAISGQKQKLKIIIIHGSYITLKHSIVIGLLKYASFKFKTNKLTLQKYVVKIIYYAII